MIQRLLRWLGTPSGLRAGKSTLIDRTVRVAGHGVVIGEHCRLQRGVFLRGPEVVIGDRVFLNDGVYVNHHVTIGNDVSIGQFTRLITGSHEMGPASHRAGRTLTEPIVIGAGTWIGASVTVLPGIRIGSGCVIGSGSVVTKDCADNGVYYGTPAKWQRGLDAS